MEKPVLTIWSPSARAFPATPDRIQMMPRLLTADDIMPLVASLPDSERIRLLGGSPRPAARMPRSTALRHQMRMNSQATTSRWRGKLTAGKSFIDSGRDPLVYISSLAINAVRLWCSPAMKSSTG